MGLEACKAESSACPETTRKNTETKKEEKKEEKKKEKKRGDEEKKEEKRETPAVQAAHRTSLGALRARVR